MLFALAYGSFGDLLETARLAVKIVQFLRDSGQVSQERRALAIELQILNKDLTTLYSVASEVHLDPSCTRSLPITTRIRSEVTSCRVVLAGFIHKLNAPRGIFGTIVVALAAEKELAKFRTDISKPVETIHTLMATLNLVTSHGIRSQLNEAVLNLEAIGSRVERIESQVLTTGGRIALIENRLVACHTAVLKLPVPLGVCDAIFCVVDPLGGNIIISLRYCHSYTDLDRIVKAHIPPHRREAGGVYVQRGDYDIVSAKGTIVLPVDFTMMVEAGMQFEMSIVKRRLQYPSSQAQESTQCPHCNHKNTDETENDWFKCANPKCGRKYRIDVKDWDKENSDSEEIVSPQIAQEKSGREPPEPELFRLVHLYTIMSSAVLNPRFRPFVSAVHHVTKGRYITSNDPRGYIPVYEYPLNSQWIMMDIDDGYISWTGIWKALGNSKADMIKMIDSQPGLANVIRRVHCGYLKIQGTWMPFEIALRLARRVAWNIREDLIPLFGPTFPSTCLSPDLPGYGQVVSASGLSQNSFFCYRG